MSYLPQFNIIGSGSQKKAELIPANPDDGEITDMQPDDYVVDADTLSQMIRELPDLGSGFHTPEDHPDYPVLSEALDALRLA